MTIGNKIYTLRTKSGMTQEQLAEKMGVSRQAISKWESDVSVPELNKLKTLANLFHVTLDEMMGETPPEKKIHDSHKKIRNTDKLPQLISSLAVVCLGVATIVQASSIRNMQYDIDYLHSEISRLTSMVSYEPSEPEESLFQDYNYDTGEIQWGSKTFLFSFQCVPKAYTESTKVTLTMEASNGEVYNMELEGDNGIFKGEMELPICTIQKTLFIQEDQGVKQVEVEYGMIDMVQEVYPDFYARMPMKDKIEEIEFSMVNEENDIQPEQKKKLEMVTLQICEGVDEGNLSVLWETKLSEEEVLAISKDEKVTVPVKLEREPSDFIYFRVLFKHMLLDEQQISTSVEIDSKERGIAVMDMYYEGSSFYLEQ